MTICVSQVLREGVVSHNNCDLNAKRKEKGRTERVVQHPQNLHTLKKADLQNTLGKGEGCRDFLQALPT